MSASALKTSFSSRVRVAAPVAPACRVKTRHNILVPRAAVAEQVDTSELVSVVKQAVNEVRSVPGPKVLQSILSLEKQKLKLDEAADILSAKGTHWKLVILAGKDAVKAAMKGDTSKGTYYSPFVAAQNFDAPNKDFENGVFLGNVAYLTFSGPYYFDGKIFTFDVVKMNVGAGPWKASFNLKPDSPLSKLPEDPQAASVAAKQAKLPFFSYIYVDNDIIVGRGRSGGLAVWSKGDAQWEAENGVLQVYGDK